MSSEESRDTEYWSNDPENSALHDGINYILKYIQTISPMDFSDGHTVRSDKAMCGSSATPS